VHCMPWTMVKETELAWLHQEDSLNTTHENFSFMAFRIRIFVLKLSNILPTNWLCVAHTVRYLHQFITAIILCSAMNTFDNMQTWIVSKASKLSSEYSDVTSG